MGKTFTKLANELRRDRQAPPDSISALVIPEKGLSSKPWPPDWRYATAYMKLIEQGKRPAIVLESRAGDAAYLKERGIRELIPLTA